MSVIFYVHISDMLPRQAHGPLREETRVVLGAPAVNELQSLVCIMRSGLSGKRWHLWGTCFDWWIDRGEKRRRPTWNER